MILTKTKLFLALCLLLVFPFILQKLIWLSGTETTNGTMGFVGKSYTGQLIHTYSNISFKVGDERIWFNGNDNILFKEGSVVPVRYSRLNPHEACINIFASVWGDTVVYGGIPLLILSALFLHRHIIPRHSLLQISFRKPYMKLIGP